MRDTTQETVTPMSARRRLVRTAAIAAAVAAPLTISAGCFGGELPGFPSTGDDVSGVEATP
jgi:hypothetical protein